MTYYVGLKFNLRKKEVARYEDFWKKLFARNSI